VDLRAATPALGAAVKATLARAFTALMGTLEDHPAGELWPEGRIDAQVDRHRLKLQVTKNDDDLSFERGYAFERRGHGTGGVCGHGQNCAEQGVRNGELIHLVAVPDLTTA